ncbi:LPS export ABC transporter permease LptG [Novosphingobium flavum]|uniref:LPS export ABC transporter permease LptG n=1 Tax=Novosphingobium aerophilum TaxID=2839843 RepID=A0A7X1F6Q2_9SPHN|nr:LPS export ABC transporter permease LptG [Novosphingobium aerophilum]MBC2651264.1 LPS export ABC transporter permease LptG [Novosphingobium aerophilum]MBC2661270.1 LPS export ABC transporter permease LptG [Novosphingobium aerophilum]
MQLEFFPSRTLTLYLVRLFATRIIGVLLMLVLVLQMLDLLSESGDILAYPGNGEPQLWTYVSLRAPQLVARFLPYSVLLATILTLATLNQNSEVIAMKAAGLSAHQVLAPLLLTALVISGVSFAFNERFVARASATLKAWQAVDFGPIPQDTAVRSNVYLRDGNNILMARLVTGTGRATVLDDVTWYRRDSRMMVTEQVRARRARWTAAGWALEQPVRFDVHSTTQTPLPALAVAPDVPPATVELTNVDPDGQNVFELAHTIRALKASGRHTDELEGKWWHRLSGPLSALLMPLLGAIAAFGLARSGQLLVRAVIGMALGFAYFVIDNAALAIGNFGGYPPLVAAWAPFLLFALIGETVLIRTEE